MADQNPPNDALAQALVALAAAVTQLNAYTAGGGGGGGAGAGGGGGAPPGPLLDPFDAATPFDLAARAGSTAYATACSALDETWDGMPDTLPAFVVCLRIRSAEVKWDAAAPNGILTYGAHDLLTAHHSISEATLEAARVNRQDPRARQNAKSMYECLKKSISGDLRSNLFEQASNLMTEADGPCFFKKMLSFTTVSSLQLSMMSFNQILQFDPALHQFSVPTINKTLNHLFVLATTGTRTLDDQERIQHTLTVYQRIRQPEIWAQWVRNQVDAFEQGTFTICQAFMNTAVIKYNKICMDSPGHSFPGSVSTLQEDIVAMMSTVKRKYPPAKPDAKVKKEPKTNDDPKIKLPPFVKHFKSSTGSDGQKFKVGDKKTWNNSTWYFCDCPNHRDKVKWHTHEATECRTRKKWLEKENEPRANLAADDDDDASVGTEPEADAPTADPGNDLTAMLANALTLAQDNPEATELISDALECIRHG
jgi:hypothetical protein